MRFYNDFISLYLLSDMGILLFHILRLFQSLVVEVIENNPGKQLQEHNRDRAKKVGSAPLLILKEVLSGV